MKETKTNVMRILEKERIDYEAKFYPHGKEAVDGVTVAVEQTAAVENVITFGFVGLETFTGILLAILLIFLNVEKNIGREQAEIKARREGK